METRADFITQNIDEAFDLAGPPVSVPFLIHETARKHQHTFSEVTA